MKHAALFDMDKTLVPVNTATLYLRWRYRRNEARRRDLLRFGAWMLRYAVGDIDAEKISRDALADLRGTDEATFRRECNEWFQEEVAPLVSDAARREVDKRRDEGRELAILSASTNYSVEPLARMLGIQHVLCTELKVGEDGRFTGEADLCFGARKKVRAVAWAEREGVGLWKSAFYTDSHSDLPVLLHVGEPRVINPDPRLRALAALYGWPVERWG